MATNLKYSNNAGNTACRLVVLVFTITLFPALLQAQLKWKPSGIHNDSLPPSLRVYETTDSLDGAPFRAYYLAADLNDPQIIMETRTGKGKRYTPEEYQQQEPGKVYAIVNACFFSYADNSNLNMVVSDGKIVAFNKETDTLKSASGKQQIIYPTQGVFGILKNGQPDIAWVYNLGKNKRAYEYDAPNAPYNGIAKIPGTGNGRKWEVTEAAGGGPVLLPYISSVQENRFAWHEMDKHPRTAIGYTEDHKVIILAVEGRHPGIAMGATLPQLALIMKKLGCVEALNLDGGGSSCLWVDGKNTITPSDKGQRPVPSIFIIKGR